MDAQTMENLIQTLNIAVENVCRPYIDEYKGLAQQGIENE